MKIDLILALPEVVLLAGACALMLLDLFVKSERRGASFAMAQGVLAASALATIFVLMASNVPDDRGQVRVLVVEAFHGLYVADYMGHMLKLVAYAAVSMTLFYSR